ncbi:MAG: hypothetical protein IJV71_10225 [Lachnospiraceae bacterium]|nr:hypothetical protein [Lachnospiraceae bacterium]
MINNIIQFLKIDNNTFWTIICTLFVQSIVPFIWNFIKGRREESRKYWYIETKYKNDNFYVTVLIVSLIEGFFIVFIEVFTYHYFVNKVVTHSISVVLLLVFIIHINSRKSVKLGLLRVRKKIGIVLVDLPIIILTLGMSFSIWMKKTAIIFPICIVATFILEIIGCVMFHYSYTIYQFSYVDITMNAQENIKRVEVDNIKKKGKWLIVKDKDRKRMILFDAVKKFDYYGETKYIYHNLYKRKQK